MYLFFFSPLLFFFFTEILLFISSSIGLIQKTWFLLKVLPLWIFIKSNLNMFCKNVNVSCFCTDWTKMRSCKLCASCNALMLKIFIQSKEVWSFKMCGTNVSEIVRCYYGINFFCCVFVKKERGEGFEDQRPPQRTARWV